MGRPKMLGGSSPLGIMIDCNTKENIDLLAEKSGVSRNKIIKMAVVDLLKKTSLDYKKMPVYHEIVDILNT